MGKKKLERAITLLAEIGTIGPLIGLVGTVVAMIKAFIELGRGGTPDAARLADAISQALVLTMLGVALAVPAILCHVLLIHRSGDSPPADE